LAVHPERKAATPVGKVRAQVIQPPPHSPSSGGQPHNRRDAAEHQRFGEYLHDDAPSAGAERGPHDDLGLARGRAREHQQPDVGAHEREEHDDEDVPGQQRHRSARSVNCPHRFGET
jgi:hypothetical protein